MTHAQAVAFTIGQAIGASIVALLFWWLGRGWWRWIFGPLFTILAIILWVVAGIGLSQ